MLSFIAPLTFPNPRLSNLRHLLRPAPLRSTCSSAASDESYMPLALSQSRIAASLGEVPIGAVLVSPSGTVLSTGHNLVDATHDATHDATEHAELVCLRRGMAARSNWRMLDTILYLTLEPCPMCLSALALARVRKVVYAATDLRLGACGTWIDLNSDDHACHRYDEVRGGMLEDEAAHMMREFFRRRRADSKAAKNETVSHGEEGISAVLPTCAYSSFVKP